jgi:hypothetical protein
MPVLTIFKKRRKLMKKILLLILIMISSIASAQAEKTKDAEQSVQLMFVQTAHNVAFNNGTLTLKGVGPTTLFFADRPKREVGHMTMEDFLKDWNEGEDNFATDPPNAVLSIFDKDKITDVVIVLSKPRLKDQNLSYDVKILDGEMPATGGESSLFIDPRGMPRTPTSRAGVHRRHRRRHAIRR